MVSKVCHSQLSSSTFARAAHMPPWAAPVWERVGYSLVMTAVRARLEASRAARRPAPPAPTITTSKVCCWVMGLLGLGVTTHFGGYQRWRLGRLVLTRLRVYLGRYQSVRVVHL